MKTLFIDCRSGVCTDMILSGLLDMGLNIDCAETTAIRELVIEELNPHIYGHAGEECEGHVADHEHEHAHEDGHHHTSYATVRRIIEKAPLTEEARAIASKIYEVIARSEAAVHGTDLENVHFHEVGRAEAIINILAVAMCIADLSPDDIVCSDIHDGCGAIECSHGTIPVPVPAVQAMKELPETKALHLSFVQDAIESEMVTPSGLGILVGIGARFGYYPEDDPVLARGMGRGGRELGLPGMEITLLEDGEFEQ